MLFIISKNMLLARTYSIYSIRPKNYDNMSNFAVGTLSADRLFRISAQLLTTIMPNTCSLRPTNAQYSSRPHVTMMVTVMQNKYNSASMTLLISSPCGIEMALKYCWDEMQNVQRICSGRCKDIISPRIIVCFIEGFYELYKFFICKLTYH